MHTKENEKKWKEMWKFLKRADTPIPSNYGIYLRLTYAMIKNDGANISYNTRMYTWVLIFRYTEGHIKIYIHVHTV